MGVDPSLRGTGLAILEFRGREEMTLLASRTVKLKANLSFVDCLGAIAGAVTELLARHAVESVSMEQTIYVQNVRTAQLLGAARGAAIAAIATRKIPVAEYPPLRIKQAVVGFGRASKEQVSRTVQSMLRLEACLGADESDAAAAAICHAFTSGKVALR